MRAGASTSRLGTLATLGADAADRYGVTPAEIMHTAIARRVFHRVGPMAAPVRAVHDRAAAGAYAATRRGLRLMAVAARRVPATPPDAEEPFSRSRRGRDALAALNALSGDHLADMSSPLAITMAVRVAARDLPLTAAAVRAAYPAARPAVVVFLHGLAESEEWWERRPGAGRTRAVRFARRLQEDEPVTAVHVRYNTGLHISDNGERLSALLGELVGAWPVPVRSLVLVGHSMGGLVVRAACHHGATVGARWTTLVRHVVTLGTPHHGAPLAKTVHAAAWALRLVPETHALAHVLDTRSAGIRDLRLGALHADDWRDDAWDSFADRRRAIPLLPHSAHTFVSATLSADPSHPLGRAAGDLLVRTESAGGRCRERTIPVPEGSVVHLGGLTHFDLLDHPLVYAVLRNAVHAAVASAR